MLICGRVYFRSHILDQPFAARVLTTAPDVRATTASGPPRSEIQPPGGSQTREPLVVLGIDRLRQSDRSSPSFVIIAVDPPNVRVGFADAVCRPIRNEVEAASIRCEEWIRFHSVSCKGRRNRI